MKSLEPNFIINIVESQYHRYEIEYIRVARNRSTKKHKTYYYYLKWALLFCSGQSH